MKAAGGSNPMKKTPHQQMSQEAANVTDLLLTAAADNTTLVAVHRTATTILENFMFTLDFRLSIGGWQFL